MSPPLRPGEEPTAIQHTGSQRANQRFVLVVRHGPQRGQRIPLNSALVRIGKDTGCDLQLTHETVSRRHCEIKVAGPRILVRDLSSTNGTKVDGARIREAYLEAGSLLQIGAVGLRLEPVMDPGEPVENAPRQFGNVKGSTPSMRWLFQQLHRLAGTEIPLLLEGEPGTGKSRLARAVHGESRRARGPLVVVACDQESSVLETLLFGSTQNGKPGASSLRTASALERAAGGTLLLERLCECPRHVQDRLHAVLESSAQERAEHNLNGARPGTVRWVSTSRHNLSREVERGRFSPGLWEQLGIACLTVPPLRERQEDIPVLVQDWIDEQPTAQRPRHQSGLPEPWLQMLRDQPWPGNLVELERTLERSVSLLDMCTRAEQNIESGLGNSSPPSAPSSFDPSLSYRDTKARWEADMEVRYVRWLLERHVGNVSAAARAADMDRKYLHKLARRHGLR